MCEEFWEENRSFKGKSSTGFIVNVDIYLDLIFISGDGNIWYMALPDMDSMLGIQMAV